MTKNIVCRFHYDKVEVKREELKSIEYDEKKDIYSIEYLNGKVVEASNVEYKNGNKDVFVLAICIIESQPKNSLIKNTEEIKNG